jgi:hypothetical protein
MYFNGHWIIPFVFLSFYPTSFALDLGGRTCNLEGDLIVCNNYLLEYLYFVFCIIISIAIVLIIDIFLLILKKKKPSILSFIKPTRHKLLSAFVTYVLFLIIVILLSPKNLSYFTHLHLYGIIVNTLQNFQKLV